MLRRAAYKLDKAKISHTTRLTQPEHETVVNQCSISRVLLHSTLNLLGRSAAVTLPGTFYQGLCVRCGRTPGLLDHHPRIFLMHVLEVYQYFPTWFMAKMSTS